jgi:hypothetical protein
VGEVVVKLGRGATADVVMARAAELDVALGPLHPGAADAELASYLTGQVDDAAADGVIQRLLRCDGVEGAYVKPAGAPP